MSIQTTERMLEFTLSPNEYGVVDTAFALSQMNRRSYRQGYEYAFDRAEIFQTDPVEQAEVTISRLPNTWVVVNSWVKAYHAWKGQQEAAMESSETWSLRAAYRDFKVCYNHGHASGTHAGVPANLLLPADSMTLAIATGIDPGASMEWTYSEFVVPNLDGNAGIAGEYLGYMLGDDATPGKGLIKAYAESRARPHPEDPSTVTYNSITDPEGGLYTAMIDVGEDLVEVMENIEGHNQAAPYLVGGFDSEHEFYPGGSNDDYGGHGITFDTMIVRGSSLMSTDSTGPFTALCGLIWLYNAGDADTTIRFWLAPGPYKGVMARPMLEAN